MIATEDVYSPEEIAALRKTYGWTNYIFSSAHARRMQEANAAACDARFAAHVQALTAALPSPAIDDMDRK